MNSFPYPKEESQTALPSSWTGFASTPIGTSTIVSISIVPQTSAYYVAAVLIQEPAIAVLITELEAGYLLLKPILAAVHKVENGFVASFSEANIYASGDSVSEAANNLKSLIIDIFDLLRQHTLKTLGPEPRKQRAVLASHIVKT